MEKVFRIEPRVAQTLLSVYSVRTSKIRTSQAKVPVLPKHETTSCQSILYRTTAVAACARWAGAARATAGWQRPRDHFAGWERCAGHLGRRAERQCGAVWRRGGGDRNRREWQRDPARHGFQRFASEAVGRHQPGHGEA